MSALQLIKRTPSFFISVRSFASKWKSENEIHKYHWSKEFRADKTRCYFPRPNETMRIKKHGWDTRMSTPGGRKILMNRILKQRHVLSH